MASYTAEPRSPFRSPRHNSNWTSNYTTRDNKISWRETSADDAVGQFSPRRPFFMEPEMTKAEVKKRAANPMPIGICGFIISLGPLACDLIGWRGAGGNGAASIPVYLFFGGILMLTGGVLEFSQGNTFPSVVFTSFGAFWLSFGGTLIPSFNAYAAYAPANAASESDGLQTQGFNSSFGFFTLSMCFLCFIYLICAVRTNVLFVVIFFVLTLSFGFITGAYWALGSGFAENADFARMLIQIAGACALSATGCGWWIFLSVLLKSLDFPFSLPLGDLSNRVLSGSNQKYEV